MTGSAFTVSKPVGAERAALAAGVGRMLAAARTAAGLTQKALAVHAGVGAATVAAIEQGASRPSWRTLQLVAAALCPGDAVRAEALAHVLADAAGPSLAGDPLVPPAIAREVAVEVLVRAAQQLGFDLDDMRVRRVVVEQLRFVAGSAAPLHSPDMAALPQVASPAGDHQSDAATPSPEVRSR